MSTPATQVSDEELVRGLRSITFRFCAAQAVLLLLGLVVLVPDGSLTGGGVLMGGALGAVSWFGSRWASRWALARARRDASGDAALSADAALRGTTSQDAAARVQTAAFIGVAFAEALGLLGLVVAMLTGERAAMVLAIPVAIIAIIVNGTGPIAVRRHLDTLRA